VFFRKQDRIDYLESKVENLESQIDRLYLMEAELRREKDIVPREEYYQLLVGIADAARRRARRISIRNGADAEKSRALLDHAAKMEDLAEKVLPRRFAYDLHRGLPGLDIPRPQKLPLHATIRRLLKP